MTTWVRFCAAALPDVPLAVAESWHARLHAMLAPSPTRAYHNIHHITDLLERLAQYSPASTDATTHKEIKLAIWFHDIVYDGRRSDNEEQSALVFAEFAAEAKLAANVTREVTQWILETKRHTTSTHHPPDGLLQDDFNLFLDLDMSILGASPARYQTYTRQVRQEYIHVPDDQFRAGRSRFLRSLLEDDGGKALFRTERVRQALLPVALANISRELQELSSPSL